MQKNRTAMWIVVGICAFALGFLGVRLIQLQKNTTIENGAIPVLPSAK